jgi:hypothetical protein
VIPAVTGREAPPAGAGAGLAAAESEDPGVAVAAAGLTVPATAAGAGGADSADRATQHQAAAETAPINIDHFNRMVIVHVLVP